MIDKYLQHLTSVGRAKNTIRQAKSILWNFEVESLLHPTQDEILDYISQKNRMPETLKHRYNILFRFYRWLYENGRLLENPMSKIVSPKLPKVFPQKVMTPGETMKVLETSKKYSIMDQIILELLYTCSLRASEVASLNVEHYDSEHKILRIEKSKTRKGRLVPVGKIAAELLEKYLEDKEKGPMFLSRAGRRIVPNYVTEMTRAVRIESGIRTKATSHSFRKSSATHMLRKGAPLSAVQALLGHAHMSSTEVYTKIYPKDLVRMHRAYHPREREKGLDLPILKPGVGENIEAMQNNDIMYRKLHERFKQVYS